MKTLSVEEATEGLGRLVALALAGEQIQIRQGSEVVELRPTQATLSASGKILTPRGALWRLQDDARMTPQQAEEYLHELREEPRAVLPKATKSNRGGGFTLVELLTVIAVIGVLAALLLPVLSRAKTQGQSTVCKNHLSQIGKAMELYISDNNMYPLGVAVSPPPRIWPDRLTACYPLNWTNVSWHCPTYIDNGGIVKWQLPPVGGHGWKGWISYSYNARGMTRGVLSVTPTWLGLQDVLLTVPDHQVVAPSQMYAVADARPIRNQKGEGFVGTPLMDPWKLLGYTEGNPPHSQGYNMLFNDVHVDLVKRKDYLYPPRTAHNWNRDNQLHSDLWAATNEWAVQN